jgi:hypothetical protein
MRAAAAGNGTQGQSLKLNRVEPCEFCGLMEQVIDPWMGKMVEDITTFALSGHQPGFAQQHQVLRYARLTHAHHSFKVANARFLSPQNDKDLDPGGLPDHG